MDGPAAAKSLNLRRAPTFLRVVVAPDGTIDALDQLEDVPEPDETIHVYRIVAGGGHVHVCFRGKDSHLSGWYATGIYRHVADAPPLATLRDTAAWRAWVLEQVDALNAQITGRS